MIAMRHHNGRCRGPRAFTLIELLITMSIIAIMASMVLVGLYSAQSAGKESKTKALIAKLDSIIKNRWESYRTRRVPVNLPVGMPRAESAKARLDALRDLMRLEMPDRWSDVTDNPAAPFASVNNPMPITIARPSVSAGYLRKYNALVSPPSGQYAGAECLYLIVMSGLSEEGDAREVFKPGDVGDVDGDGMREFIDAWGQPIKFIRWPAGFQLSELQIVFRGSSTGSGGTANVTGNALSTTAGAYLGGAIIATDPSSPYDFDVSQWGRITDFQSTGFGAGTVKYSQSVSVNGGVVILAPDPFDAAGVYSAGTTPGFATYPLIYSAGPDRCYGMTADFDSMNPLRYAIGPVNLNPFYSTTDQVSGLKSLIGCARNEPLEQYYSPNGWLDNVHNHFMGRR